MNIFLTLREANIARQAEWDPSRQIDRDWRMNELAGEVGECCNVLKKLHRERCNLPGSRATKAELADELADVVICLDLLLMQEGYPAADSLPEIGILTLTNAGQRLFRRVAQVFHTITFEASGSVILSANSAYAFVAAIAASEGINLDLAVANKFNATTRKVGLTTFLRLDLTDN